MEKNKDILNEFMYKEIYDMIENKKNKSVFKMKSDYGKGIVYLYEIFKGVFVSYNDYGFIKSISNFKEKEITNEIIIVHHCISGSYLLNLKNNLSASVSGGDSHFYGGTVDFLDSETGIKGCKTVSIFCYWSDFKNLATEIMGFKQTELESFNCKICNSLDMLVAKTNVKTIKIIEEITEAIMSENIPKLKIKTLELIYRNIVDYDDYKLKSKKLYNKNFLKEIVEIKKFLENNWEKSFTIDEISNKFAINQTYIKEGFKYLFESGPSTYMRKYRLKKSLELLKKKDLQIIEIAAICGYSNPSKFSKAFKKEFGLLPSKYKNKI